MAENEAEPNVEKPSGVEALTVREPNMVNLYVNAAGNGNRTIRYSFVCG